MYWFLLILWLFIGFINAKSNYKTEKIDYFLCWIPFIFLLLEKALV